ncbi:arsenic resistance protein [Cryobacterium sp. PAMC25264]|uniref:arsenic resistance protein n=1 Tax=Cryobacterium sp. PAMC25264 TaxID=2861288 RepID=UPI001C62CB39|nr:hypothetical protein [Cryobacterium sp. PAMC25264]QYF73638.1 hypothetical protein KY500_18530 [Cryobacterium sp. PAMC25264]
MRLLTRWAAPRASALPAVEAGSRPWLLTALLLGAIVAGSLLGTWRPGSAAVLSAWVDPTVLTLLVLLFFEVRFLDVRRLRAAPRFLLLAWCANFLVVPLIGVGVASLFLSGEPLLFTGLLIYFVAPCTDWFLGFTRLAGGNITLGSVLLPLNLLTQLALFPVFLALFARIPAGLDVPSLLQTLGQWFLAPIVLAAGLRALLAWALPAAVCTRLLGLVGRMIPGVIALLIVEIFTAHIGTILNRVDAFLVILVAVMLFFLLTYLVGDLLSRLFGLDYPEHALLTMTTAARNAPLMLGLTTVALPGQPLVYAAIIIGMLVEFPHLTVIRALLLRRRLRVGECPEVRA